MTTNNPVEAVSGDPSQASENGSSRATLAAETLAPRILLSATWIDAQTEQPQDAATDGDDVGVGTAEADSLFGGGGDDELQGLAGDDSLFGGDGDDVLVGGAGDDELSGGEGYDTARFSGAREDYSVEQRDDGALSVVGPDGADVLSGIEHLEFSDGFLLNLGEGLQLAGAEVEATPGETIPLSLELTNTTGSAATLTLGGLPEGATLSAGVDLGGGAWRLAEAELAGATLTTPADFQGDVELTLAVSLQTEVLAESTIDRWNYGAQDQGYHVTARTITSDGDLSDADASYVHSDSSGLGVQGFTGDLAPTQQLGYDAKLQLSEQLIFDFDEDVHSAQANIERLFASEGYNSGGETGRWQAFDDGVLVGEGDFIAASGHQVAVEISAGEHGRFDRVVFLAKEYGDGQNGQTNDASDYQVKSLTFRTPRVEETTAPGEHVLKMAIHEKADLAIEPATPVAAAAPEVVDRRILEPAESNSTETSDETAQESSTPDAPRPGQVVGAAHLQGQSTESSSADERGKSSLAGSAGRTAGEAPSSSSPDYGRPVEQVATQDVAPDTSSIEFSPPEEVAVATAGDPSAARTVSSEASAAGMEDELIDAEAATQAAAPETMEAASWSIQGFWKIALSYLGKGLRRRSGHSTKFK